MAGSSLDSNGLRRLHALQVNYCQVKKPFPHIVACFREYCMCCGAQVQRSPPHNELHPLPPPPVCLKTEVRHSDGHFKLRKNEKERWSKYRIAA